jgi:hypothetical protein
MRVGEKKRKRFGLLKYGNLILVAIDPHLGRYFAIEIWFQNKNLDR